MGMVDGLIEQLGNSPAVQDAMGKLIELREGVIQAMAHFNTRLDVMDGKLDRIIFSIEHPSDIAPAADDGLMKLLADDGQEMIIQEVEAMPMHQNPELHKIDILDESNYNQENTKLILHQVKSA